jgi:predicted heme/steroid binding protein
VILWDERVQTGKSNHHREAKGHPHSTRSFRKGFAGIRSFRSTMAATAAAAAPVVTKKKKSVWGWFALALVVAALALGWPLIEQQLRAQGGACPWPFSLLKPFMPAIEDVPVSAESAAASAALAADSAAGDKLRVFTLEELKKYDGSDAELPILLAIGGKVVDVSSGAKFYAPGKMYSQFAGTACTRALTLGSLDKKVGVPIERGAWVVDLSCVGHRISPTT